MSTISRDVKALKQMSQQFVFDLAKSDLAYHYKQCINGIEEIRRKAWASLRDDEEQQLLTLREKLLILKLIKECEEGKFTLFKDGLRHREFRLSSLLFSASLLLIGLLQCYSPLILIKDNLD
ncbi:MAG TPA: hypothetical protein VFY68_11375 [Nitrososphaeraceae archaeon]|nr:hypothetical protein [Nitrososphaeraceae archaeon]